MELQMLDTLVLNLENNFWINDFSRFQSLKGNDQKPFIQMVANPTRKSKLTRYSPRLTLYRFPNGFLRLRIEFSVPKLLFNNNFVETNDINLSLLVNKLQSELQDVGIKVLKSVLSNATVSTAHFSKNIILSNYITCSMILRELEKVDLTKRLDLEHRHYKDNGHSVYYYSKSHHLVAYNKTAELSLSKPHSRQVIEKDNHIQMHLFDDPNKPRGSPPEIIRFEVRLVKRTKLRSELKKLGFEECSLNPSLKNIINNSISKFIVNEYWDIVWDSIDLICLSLPTIADLVDVIQKHCPTVTNAKCCELAVIIKTIEESGVRRARQLYSNSSKWSRDKNILKSINFDKNYLFDEFKEINMQIKEFQPITEKMLNISNINNIIEG